ncbi:uncharacterized protein LOC119909711 [Micropterus salmoides]|uniref:uncharacterized protein LOC119909711 n=1 Tax=Micropterus salmoides TaxID=27706 RepID=UPI0018EA36BC|nr:uncharacterized protein LOC119909711 [Micropterus salmoides]
MKCFVPGCGNVRTSRLSTPQKFHVFPSDPALCCKWLEAIKNPCFDPKVTTVLMTRVHGLRVCSDHFRHKDYVGGKRHYYAGLKRGTVPSLLPWTEREAETEPTTSMPQQQKIQTPHQCTMCETSRPMSEMVHHKSDENTVELFCTRTCVTSYTLRPAIKDAKTTSDSAVNENDASAADSDTPTLIITDSCVLCCHCGKKLPKGQTLYQPQNSPEVFCSSSCLSERHPSIKVATKNCYNCFQ